MPTELQLELIQTPMKLETRGKSLNEVHNLRSVRSSVLAEAIQDILERRIDKCDEEMEIPFGRTRFKILASFMMPIDVVGAVTIGLTWNDNIADLILSDIVDEQK
ncbi:hypothetical protein Tco_1199327 [Tanacetum coccineum]